MHWPWVDFSSPKVFWRLENVIRKSFQSKMTYWFYAKQLFVRVNLLLESIGPAPQQLSDLPIGIGQTIQICFHCWQDLTSSLTSSKEMWIECWIAWSLDPFYILMLHGIGSWCEQKKRAAGSGSIQFLVRYHTSVFLVVYCQESVDVVLMQKNGATKILIWFITNIYIYTYINNMYNNYN